MGEYDMAAQRSTCQLLSMKFSYIFFALLTVYNLWVKFGAGAGAGAGACVVLKHGRNIGACIPRAHQDGVLGWKRQHHPLLAAQQR